MTASVRQATSTIPIVMLVVADPVGQGFVKTLARPGGNVTGMTNLVPGLVQKYIELLRQAVPKASRVATIASPPNPLPEHRREADAAARAFGMVASIVHVNGPNEFDEVLGAGEERRCGGDLAAPDGVTFLNRRHFVQTALKNRLPGMYWTREYVEEGGLMTYSADLADLRRPRRDLRRQDPQGGQSRGTASGAAD